MNYHVSTSTLQETFKYRRAYLYIVLICTTGESTYCHYNYSHTISISQFSLWSNPFKSIPLIVIPLFVTLIVTASLLFPKQLNTLFTVTIEENIAEVLEQHLWKRILLLIFPFLREFLIDAIKSENEFISLRS